MWRVVAVVGAIVFASPGAGAENLTSQAFTTAFAAATTEAIPSVKVKVTGDLQLEIRYADGRTATVNLANIYGAYLHDPTHLKDVLRNFVAGVLPPQVQASATKPDRSRIVPVLKNRQWFDRTQQLLKADGKELQHSEAPVGGELVVVYAEDAPVAVRYLTNRDDVGDRAKLYDAALANLRRVLPKIEMRPGADGIFLISAGGEYEASLLLVDALWSGGQIKVDGDIVAAVPAKDALIVTGSRNVAGIARLRKLVTDLAKGPYALTPALFVYRNGKFAAFDGK